MVLKRSPLEKIVVSLIYLLLILFGIVTLLPFLNVAAKSLSGEIPVVSGKVLFWPMDLQVQTYAYVFREGTFINALKVSVIITVLGTVLAMIITTMMAYPLSRQNFRGRKLYLYLWIFVMLFQGGIIPNYVLYKSLGLTNTLFAMIFPQLVNVFNLLVIKNYMESIPESLDEAARIDGASNFRTLFQIIVPVSMPVLATVSLFYAVGYWNDYFFAMLYINKPSLKPLQQYLYDIITTSMLALNTGVQAQSVKIDTKINMTPESLRAATIMVSTVPILLVYPFLQKYFIKGMVLGSIKE